VWAALPRQLVFAPVDVGNEADGRPVFDVPYLGGNAGGFSQNNQYYDTKCGNVTLDSSGNVIVYGYTSYTDWPTTPGAYQTTVSGNDLLYGWVAVLSPDLSTLVAGTYIGQTCAYNATPMCTMLDNSGGIGLDSSGNIYGSFATASNSWPVTSNGYNQTYVGESNDIVILGLSPDLTTLVYGTYLAGPTPSGYTGVSQGNWPWAMRGRPLRCLFAARRLRKAN
jgi:hypothetical protein